MNKKKFSFSFHSLFSFSRCISHNFLLLSLFFFSLLLAHSLTQFCQTTLSPQSHLLGLHFFFPLPKWLNGLSLLFLSPFLPSTLLTSNHSKCKPLTLTLLQPKSLSSALIGRMALLVSFLFSSACPTHFGSLLIKRSQTSHKSWSDKLIK